MLTTSSVAQQSLHSVAVCVPTHCYAVCWFMPTARGLPRPLPPPSPCIKWLLVSFKRNCRSGRIFSVTRQCLNGDSVSNRRPTRLDVSTWRIVNNLCGVTTPVIPPTDFTRVGVLRHNWGSCISSYKPPYGVEQCGHDATKMSRYLHGLTQPFHRYRITAGSHGEQHDCFRKSHLSCCKNSL